MSEKRTGGCLCGGIRYELDWPAQAMVVCHCRDCQKQSGTAFSVVGVAKREALRIVGALKTFTHPGSTGQDVNRQFCPDCGSPILTDTAAARKQGIIFFKAGTLDRTTDLAPTVHYWTSSAQPWFTLPEGVTCLDTQ